MYTESTSYKNFDVDAVVLIGWDPIKTGQLYPADLRIILGIEWNTLYLIGSKYASVELGEVEKDTVILPVEPGYLFKHNRFKQDENDLMYQIKESVYLVKTRYLRDTSKSVLYICLDKTIARSIFELAALVKTETLTNKYWYCNNRLPVPSPFAGSGDFNKIEVIPDIFNGSPDFAAIKNNLSVEAKDEMKKLITMGINHLRMFLHAGYHNRENKMPVDGWALNTSSTWLSLIITINKLVPTMIDSTIEREIYDNSKIRKYITDQTLLSLSNYFSIIYFDGNIRDFIDTSSESLFSDESSGDGAVDGDRYKRWSSVKLWKAIHDEYISNDGF